jgi:hypothetical protein
MLKLIYFDDIKHSWAGHKTSPTMWSLYNGPIQQEIYDLLFEKKKKTY